MPRVRNALEGTKHVTAARAAFASQPPRCSAGPAIESLLPLVGGRIVGIDAQGRESAQPRSRPASHPRTIRRKHGPPREGPRALGLEIPFYFFLEKKENRERGAQSCLVVLFTPKSYEEERIQTAWSLAHPFTATWVAHGGCWWSRCPASWRRSALPGLRPDPLPGRILLRRRGDLLPAAA